MGEKTRNNGLSGRGYDSTILCRKCKYFVLAVVDSIILGGYYGTYSSYFWYYNSCICAYYYSNDNKYRDR